jgi:hypothetical protein
MGSCADFILFLYIVPHMVMVRFLWLNSELLASKCRSGSGRGLLPKLAGYPNVSKRQRAVGAWRSRMPRRYGFSLWVKENPWSNEGDGWIGGESPTGEHEAP